MTSSPTVAIAAAVLRRPFEITFGGATLFQYAEDVAKTLLLASRAEPVGARVFNLGGDAVAIADWVTAIEAAVPEAAGSSRSRARSCRSPRRSPTNRSPPSARSR